MIVRRYKKNLFLILKINSKFAGIEIQNIFKFNYFNRFFEDITIF